MRRNIIFRTYSILKNQGWAKLLYVAMGKYGIFACLYAKSMEDVHKWVKNNLDKYDVYSFDIFDTLLRKIIHPAELTKELACQHLSKILEQKGIFISGEQLLVKRLAIEEKLRLEALDVDFDAEFKLIDVLQLLLEMASAGSLIDYAELLDYETGLEELITEPMPGAEKVLELIKAHGKEAICISDAYFSEKQIAKVLAKNNLMYFIDRTYVSSDIMLNKKSGRLYKHVLNNENGKIVHIDNCIDDAIYMARRAGIKAIWCSNKNERQRMNRLSKLLAIKDKFKYVNAVVKHDYPRDFMFNLGYQVLGPVLTVCVHDIIEKIKGRQIEKVFFVSRDGFILRKIHNILVSGMYDERDKIPYGDYLCINKYTLTLPSIDHIGYKEIEYLEESLQKTVNFTLAQVLAGYSLYTDGFVKLLGAKAIDIHQAMTGPDSRELLCNFIESQDIQNAIEAASQAARISLYNYLSFKGFMGGNSIVMVDSISSGKTTALLNSALGDREDFPSIVGYYLCYDEGAMYFENSKAASENGILVDYRTSSPLNYRTLNTFCLISELLTQPNHGIPIGYRMLNGKAIPVLKRTDSSVERRVSKDVSDGILKYAADYARYYEAHQIPPAQLIPGARESALKYVSFPHRRDVEALKKYYVNMTWPIERNRKLVECFYPADFFQIGRAIEKLRKAVWIEGSLNYLPVPGLRLIYSLLFNAYYYRYRRRYNKGTKDSFGGN